MGIFDLPAPLDCADLAALLRRDPSEAFQQLATLTPAQLTLQAVCFTTYINAKHDLTHPSAAHAPNIEMTFDAIIASL